MSLATISGEIQAQPLNDNFSYLNQKLDYMTYNIKDDTYGAVGNGVTYDTNAILSAISAAYTAGGGIVLMPYGTFLVSATITNNYNNVGIVGVGHRSIIKAGVVMDYVLSMTSDTALGNRGAPVKDFFIDCDNKAETGLYVGATTTGTVVQRYFHNLQIQYATSYGLILDACQNNYFSLVNVEHSAACVLLLNGTGNNVFMKCEFSDGNLPQIKFTQDNTLPSWTFNIFSRIPQANKFYGCIMERSSATYTFLLEYGRENVFNGCDISSSLNSIAAIQTNTNALYSKFVDCRFMAGTSNITALINDGFLTILENSYFEGFNSTEIQTSNQLLLSNSYASDGTLNINNTFGSIAGNVHLNSALTYLDTASITSVSTYPSQMLFDSSDNIYLKGLSSNIQFNTGNQLKTTGTTSSSTTHQYTFQLNNEGMWTFSTKAVSGDGEHSMNTLFLANYKNATTYDLADIQKIGNDAVQGIIMTSLSATITADGLITLNLTLSSSSTVNWACIARNIN